MTVNRNRVFWRGVVSDENVPKIDKIVIVSQLCEVLKHF